SYSSPQNPATASQFLRGRRRHAAGNFAGAYCQPARPEDIQFNMAVETRLPLGAQCPNSMLY
ncbi:MAG: hypothetical protein WC655_29240, partial [Candidatus Hydrogenedentales bacterium]